MAMQSKLAFIQNSKSKIQDSNNNNNNNNNLPSKTANEKSDSTINDPLLKKNKF